MADHQPFKFVCCGRRRGAKGPVLILREVGPDGGLVGEDLVLTYIPKRHRSLVIGGVYVGEKEEGPETYYYVGNAKYEGGWPVEADRIRWRAEDHEAEVAERKAKQAKDARRQDEIAEALLPLRRAYASLLHQRDYAGAEALESLVRQILHRPPMKGEQE